MLSTHEGISTRAGNDIQSGLNTSRTTTYRK
jgi:hypothetical protein